MSRSEFTAAEIMLIENGLHQLLRMLNLSGCILWAFRGPGGDSFGAAASPAIQQRLNELSLKFAELVQPDPDKRRVNPAPADPPMNQN